MPGNQLDGNVGFASVLWHDQCNWAQQNNLRSNDNVIENLDQVGVLFLSDLGRQECSTCTTTSQQEFDVPDSPTGHGEEKGFSHTTNTRWRQVTRCVGHEIAPLPQHAGKINTCSHLTECAEKPEDTSRTSQGARRTGSNKSRTSQSTRMDQTKDSALLEVHK